MRVLILGGYGFIGAEIACVLSAAGYSVVGLGRDARLGARLVPGIDWIGADLSHLTTAERWTPHLDRIEAIVNAAGALQEGPRDRLSALHHLAIAACVEAAARAGVKRFVQISAVGATLSASTEFLASKGAGDAAVKAASLDWIILRPGLVIGRNAYGGTALLRMLAGLPLMTPLVAANSRIQTVAMDDVAAAVLSALRGELPTRRSFDLVEDEPHTLREIVRGLRRQIGFAPAKFEPDLPKWVGVAVSRVADVLGRLGWRSPLRTTAMRVLSENVLGDAEPWRQATGRSLRPLAETLATAPGTAQERLFARAQLASPLMIGTLAAFWIASGVIGLIGRETAAAHLQNIAGNGALGLVIAGSLLDIAVGAGILIRSTAKAATLASVAVSAVYLIAATFAEPQLWLDPFGVLLKVFPVMALGLAVALLIQER